MPRRPAVLLTSPHSTSNSSLFLALLALSREGCVLTHENEAHPFPFQSLPFILSLEGHSLGVYRGGITSVFPFFARPLVTHHSPLSFLESTLTDFAPVTPLDATLTRNPGGWRGYVN